MSTFKKSLPFDSMQSMPWMKACPGCRGGDATCFYDLMDQPVHVGVTYPDEEQARCAPRGDIKLYYCPGCGLVFNAAYEAALLDFAPGYDASLTASDQFMRFLDMIIDRLIDRHDLRGKTVLEVGCGVGHFLRRLCERANCNGIGVDPSVPAVGVEDHASQTIIWIRGLLGPEHAELSFDLLCCLDMFEQVYDPLRFLQSIRQAIPSAGGTPVYVQLPERKHVFEQGAGWSVIYEQCCYYDVASLRGLFERSGFRVTRAAPLNLNPQSVYVEAVAGPMGELFGVEDNETPETLPTNLAAFDREQRQRVAEWSAKVNAWIDAGRDVVLWGSGGKGINFLNTVPGADRIRRVVDVNPARQGRYLPRAGQQVVAPRALIDASPDVVLVSNKHWHNEIAGTIAELDLECELLDV